MAALQAERGYGLSCGRLGRGTRVSVFHVKLTESALRAFESYQACKEWSVVFQRRVMQPSECIVTNQFSQPWSWWRVPKHSALLRKRPRV